MERTEASLGDRIQVAQLGVGRAAARSEAIPDFLGRVAALAAKAVDAAGAAFWRLDGDEVTLLAGHGRPPRSAGAAVHALLSGAAHDERGEVLVANDALAVVWREGDTRLGALCAFRPASPGGFTAHDGVVLRAMAYSTGNVYGGLENLEQRRDAEERLGQMLDISQTLNSILDPDELLDTLARQAVPMLGCRAGTAGIRGPEGAVCRTFFLDGESIPFTYCWPPGQGTPGWCMVHREQYLTNDVAHDAQVVPVLGDRLTIERALCTPILDVQGEVLGFFSLYNKPGDFTQGDRELMAALANHAALALQNALAYRRLGELEQAKADFLNLAAHELRGPVATARGHLEMLSDAAAPWTESQRQGMLAVAASKLDHIRFLVDQMLTTARLEERRLKLDLEEVDLRDLMKRARDDVEYAVKPEHRVKLEAGDAPVVVRVDRQRIVAALANLIENACKYSPRGGEIAIRCRLPGPPAWAEVQIEDQGVGIAEADLPQLFSRFGRIVTSENSHVPGTGLGLYLSRQLALLHGGDITVASEAGKGSRFSLRLPLATPAGEDPHAQEFQREIAMLARRQDDIDAATPMLLPGENPSSPYPEDARHWTVVYQELLKVKEDMLEQLGVRRGRTRAAQSEVDRDEQALKLEIDRLRTHLGYWEERSANGGGARSPGA
jgi:signal transduction histidine kinase